MYSTRLRGTPIPDNWTRNEGRSLRPLEKGMLVKIPGLTGFDRVKSVTTAGATLISGRQIALFATVDYRRSKAYFEEEGIDAQVPGVVDSDVDGEDNHNEGKEKDMKKEKGTPAKIEPKKVAAAPVAPEAKPAKAPKVATEAKPKKVKAAQDKDCICGCGGNTAGYFVPGHDARFKSWLIKIAKGLGKPTDFMPATLAKALGPWTPKGDGQIPSKSYRDLRD